MRARCLWLLALGLGCGGSEVAREAEPPAPSCGVLRSYDREASPIVEARGQPTFFWETRFAGHTCRALLYGGAAGGIDQAVYDCDGLTYEAEIDPRIPCWRLAEVAARIRLQIGYFTRQPLERQWEILAGIPARGQTPGDVKLAFGDPHDVAYRQSESGGQVQVQSFLDRSGESFALDVTLIEDRVESWRIRREREVVEDARERRLQKVEEARAESAREAAATAERLHERTVDYYTRVSDGREQMRQRLVSPSTL